MRNETALILCDAHVHVHKCFDVAALFDAASLNLEARAAELGQHNRVHYLLLLTETAQADFFSSCASRSGEPETGNWTFKATSENCSIVAENPPRPPIILVAGRQIVTREKLEVLALGTTSPHADGKPIRAVIADVARDGAIPVIPWGFGKWIGRRGKIVSALLEDPQLPRFWLGDNSGRIDWFPEPAEFRRAREHGLAILPGTDPLPFAQEFDRPGRFGFSIESELDSEKPAESLKKIIRDGKAEVRPFGSLENPIRFVRNQIAMQLYKRRAA